MRRVTKKRHEKLREHPLSISSNPVTVLKKAVNNELREGEESLDSSLSVLVDEIVRTYDAYGDLEHLEGNDLPSPRAILEILDDLMIVLFPNFFGETTLTRANIRYFLGSMLYSVYNRLAIEVEKSLKYVCRKVKECSTDICHARAQTIVRELLEAIPRIRGLLAGNVNAAFNGDPAAKSPEEIVLSYPCVYAIATYLIAHELYVRGVPIIPRIMGEHAHSKTGIDIHPGAMIGRNFFIDHGTGVVIGETSEIGDNVRIYQGVTLGGVSLPRGEVSKFRDKKRHPTLGDNVIVYSGATILGGKTIVGKDSVIGGNVWITSSIPPNTTVTATSNKLSFKPNKHKTQSSAPSNKTSRPRRKR
jgi:serine O-acetyltransferase